MKPYGLMADIHCHNWHMFSSEESNGMNSRLKGILDEVKRCISEVRKRGGEKVYIAGDIFHVRGAVKPSVLNAVIDTFRETNGIEVHIIPGNHDLESKNSHELKSAVTALGSLPDVFVHNEIWCDDQVVMCPWYNDQTEMLAAVERFMAEKKTAANGRPFRECDLIVHAPVSGVFGYMSGECIFPAQIASLGQKRAFAGHFHHHKYLGLNVWSIGAIAHHTWSDVGSDAGFLIVTEDGVEWNRSALPEFVDISNGVTKEELPEMVKGNYVRVKIGSTKHADIETARQVLASLGAKGIVVQAGIKEGGRVETSGGEVSLERVETSIQNYVNASKMEDPEKVNENCQRILKMVSEGGE